MMWQSFGKSAGNVLVVQEDEAVGRLSIEGVAVEASESDWEKM